MFELRLLQCAGEDGGIQGPQGLGLPFPEIARAGGTEGRLGFRPMTSAALQWPNGKHFGEMLRPDPIPFFHPRKQCTNLTEPIFLADGSLGLL